MKVSEYLEQSVRKVAAKCENSCGKPDVIRDCKEGKSYSFIFFARQNPCDMHLKYLHQGEYVFEHMEYGTMAKRIHRVMKEVGIRKRISFHCAWHTFAVLALNKGMPIESLSRMLGHTNITTTQIYAKITMQKLEEDMDRLAERLNL